MGKFFGTHLGDLGSRSLSTKAGRNLPCPHNKVRNAYPITTKRGRYIPLIMLSTWVNFGEILPEFCFLAIFSGKISNPFSAVEHYICHILGMVGPIDVKQKGNESTGCYADWGTFDLDLWPWIVKVKLYLGNGRPNCHETNGTGVDRMPWCETLRKWGIRTLRWGGYFWPLPVTFNFQGQIVSRKWEARFSWNDRDGSQ